MEEHELAEWCIQQARDYKKGELSKVQIKKLNSINFDFDYWNKGARNEKQKNNTTP